MKKFNAREVEYAIACLPEDTGVRGNYLAFDDDVEDKKAEDAIMEDYNNGNEWAWCIVRVTAIWRGIKGTDYLGCCSYASEKDFKAKGGYYEDMKGRALEDLKWQIKEMQAKVSNVEVV